MEKFAIDITRISYSTKKFEVEANSKEEAEAIAQQMAFDHDYNDDSKEYHSEYEIGNIAEIKPSSLGGILIADSHYGVYAWQRALDSIFEKGSTLFGNTLALSGSEGMNVWLKLLNGGGLIDFIRKSDPNATEGFWEAVADFEAQAPNIHYEGVEYTIYQSEHGDIWLWPADNMEHWT